MLAKDDHPNVVGNALDRIAALGSVRAIETIEAVRKRFPNDAYIAFAVESTVRALRGHG